MIRGQTTRPLAIFTILFSFIGMWQNAAVAGEAPTLCVMNFMNRSPGEWDWLSKGLADMLVTDLSSTDKLRVVDRERLQKFLDEMALGASGLVDPDTAQKLGSVAEVRKVVFGSYEKREGKLRIEAHVVDVASGELQQVEWVEGSADDLLLLEKELAFKILDDLNVQLTVAEIESVRYQPTDSIDAASHFYQGLDLYDRGQYSEALLEMRRAIRQDSDFAEAIYHIGRIFQFQGEYAHAVVEYAKAARRAEEGRFADDALFQTAKIYQKHLKNPVLAAEKYLELIEKQPKPTLIGHDWSYGGLHYPAEMIRHEAASLFEEAGDLDRAFELYAQVVENDPESGSRTVNIERPVTDTARRALTRLIEQIYQRTGKVRSPGWGVIRLDPDNPLYEEDFSSLERLQASALWLRLKDKEKEAKLFPRSKGRGEARSSFRHATIGPFIEYSSDGTPEGSFITNGGLVKYYIVAPPGYQIREVDLSGTSEGKASITISNATGHYKRGGAFTHRPRQESWRERIQMPPGETLLLLEIRIPPVEPGKIYDWRLDTRLERLPETAILEIDSSPSPYTVLLYDDKVESCFTPCIIRNIPPGTYLLRLKPHWPEQEHRFEDRAVSLTAGERKKLSLQGVAPTPPPQLKLVVDGPIAKGAVLLRAMDGSFVLLWSRSATVPGGKGDIWFSTSRDGVDWEKPKPAPAPVNSLEYDNANLFVQQRDGRFLLTWHTRREGRFRHMVSWTRDLERWSDPVILEGPASGDALLQRMDGRYVKVINSTGSGPGIRFIKIAFSDDGIQWTPREPILNFPENYRVNGISVIEDRQGRLVAAYSARENSRSQTTGHNRKGWYNNYLYVAVSKDGHTWKQQLIASQINTEAGQTREYSGPNVLQHADGHYVLSWYQGWGEKGAFVSLSPDASSWTPPERIPVEMKLGFIFWNKPVSLFADSESSYFIFLINRDGLWVGRAEIPF